MAGCALVHTSAHRGNRRLYTTDPCGHYRADMATVQMNRVILIRSIVGFMRRATMRLENTLTAYAMKRDPHLSHSDAEYLLAYMVETLKYLEWFLPKETKENAALTTQLRYRITEEGRAFYANTSRTNPAPMPRAVHWRLQVTCVRRQGAG